MSSLKEIKQSLRLHVTSGKGFSLVVAILAILILTALGYLVVMMSTQDTRASSRVVGEKKAMAAVETGIHQLMANYDPQNMTTWSSQAYTSGATSDATSTYTIAAPSAPTGNLPLYVPLAGYSIGGGQEWGQRAYALVVTGNSTKYSATVQVDVGIGYGPIDITTMSR